MRSKASPFILLVFVVCSEASSSNISSCPFGCYLTAEKELLCTNLNSSYIKSTVPCYEDSETGRYVIGNRSSIRRIFPEGLRELLQFAPKQSLSLQLNMNILQLTPKSFVGLEGVLTSLEVLQVRSLHPGVLSNHRRLASLNFDTQRAPSLPDTFEDSTSIPAFLRLRPEDPATPLELNVDVRCHRCAGDESDLVVLTFPPPKASHTKAGGAIDALTMIYVDICPRLEGGGLGCPVNGSAGVYVVNASAPTGWTVTLTDESGELQGEGGSKPSSGGGSGAPMQPLITSIVVWCTILSLVLVMLAVIFVFARRRRAKRDVEMRQLALRAQEQALYSTPVSLKRIICGTASCEDLRRGSFCNGIHWAYGTPIQNSCSNLISETRSQYSFKPLAPGLGYPHLRGSRYSADFETGCRSSVAELNNRPPPPPPPPPKLSLCNGDVASHQNGSATLPPLPPNAVFRGVGTPAYKRSHDGTFRMQ